jgi:putative phosphoesterase
MTPAHFLTPVESTVKSRTQVSEPMRRIAVLADVHGNLPALLAAAEDIARRGIDRVMNLGDHASGPLWPHETVAFLMQQNWLQIAGNCDRQLVQQAPIDHGASDRFAFERLTSEQIQWLRALAATATVPDGILAFHGTPSNDEAYLLEAVEDGRVRLAPQAELLQRLGGVTAQLMLCGHSHIPRIVRIGDTLIVNPGSIGLPAYTHSQPEPHAMESGSPNARYAIVEKADHCWRAELVAVPYNHLAAAEQARQHARADWALALCTGYVTS